MPKILQINSVVNSGSTGHIVEDIGKLLIENGWESYVAYGRTARNSLSKLIHIGNKIDIFYHVFITRIFDLHGLASIAATKKLINQIKRIKPDLIHLHNIHGYYINYKILFNYLKESNIPVVWTMHDCWPTTGHCAYYSYVGCEKCHSPKGCKRCPIKTEYPSCVLFSNVSYNYNCKKKIFNFLSEKQLTIVTPSNWLSDEIGKSYLGHYRRIVINNGIDLNIFKPSVLENTEDLNKYVILGVANVWDERKGFADFEKLSCLLNDNEEIVLVGLNDKQIKNISNNKKIHGIKRTESQSELAHLYSRALCFVNPTYEDTFPTTNLESLACGTPVITYCTGGSPEAIDSETGFVVEQSNVVEIRKCIDSLEKMDRNLLADKCRKRAVCYFSKEKRFTEYLELYKSIIK